MICISKIFNLSPTSKLEINNAKLNVIEKYIQDTYEIDLCEDITLIKGTQILKFNDNSKLGLTFLPLLSNGLMLSFIDGTYIVFKATNEELEMNTFWITYNLITQQIILHNNEWFYVDEKESLLHKIGKWLLNRGA